MASKGGRASYPYWAHTSENNGSRPFDPEPVVLDVRPLSCFPPNPANNASSTPEDNVCATSTKTNSGPSFRELPAVVFLTSHPTTEEWKNIVSSTKNGVALTGSAAKGMTGRAIGLVDIGESSDEYLFRVSLPGVVRDSNSFMCDVQPDGEIVIQGDATTGGKSVRRNSMVFQMQTRNLCPPGKFSISFRLPGPIDHQQPVRGVFGTDGIFEALVKKKADIRHRTGITLSP